MVAQRFRQGQGAGAGHRPHREVEVVPGVEALHCHLQVVGAGVPVWHHREGGGDLELEEAAWVCFQGAGVVLVCFYPCKPGRQAPLVCPS